MAPAAASAGYFDHPPPPVARSPSPTVDPSPPVASTSSALLAPPLLSTVSRRYTTGSPSSDAPAKVPGQPAPVSKPLQKASSISSNARSVSLPKAAAAAAPAHETSQLDADILAQAEAIRKERSVRKAKKDEEDAAIQAASEAASKPPVQPTVQPTTDDGRPPTTDHVRTSMSLSRGQAPGTNTRRRLGSTASSTGGGEGRAAQRSSQQQQQQGQSTSARAVNEADAEPKVLVGNLIGEDHVNYVLCYNMLTGIRIGVSRRST